MSGHKMTRSWRNKIAKLSKRIPANELKVGMKIKWPDIHYASEITNIDCDSIKITAFSLHGRLSFHKDELVEVVV